MRTHECLECGHEVRYQGDLNGPVEHLADGRHKWSVVMHAGLTLHGFDTKAVDR